MSNNYYNILNISKDATNVEIKKAYRKLALKYHPDKNTDPQASDIFNNITEAYNVLSDPDKKKEYDNKQLKYVFSYYDTINAYQHAINILDFLSDIIMNNKSKSNIRYKSDYEFDYKYNYKCNYKCKYKYKLNKNPYNFITMTDDQLISSIKRNLGIPEPNIPIYM